MRSAAVTLLASLLIPLAASQAYSNGGGGGGSGATTTASSGGSTTTAFGNGLSNKQKVINLLASINKGNNPFPPELSYINPNLFVQHNLQETDGVQGTKDFITAINGSATINTVRAFTDGDIVWAHTDYFISIVGESRKLNQAALTFIFHQIDHSSFPHPIQEKQSQRLHSQSEILQNKNIEKDVPCCVSAKLRPCFYFIFSFTKLLRQIKIEAQFDSLSSLTHKTTTRAGLESIYRQFHEDFWPLVTAATVSFLSSSAKNAF